MTLVLIYEVVIVLVSAIVVGELFEQVGLHSVAGELLAGIILGPVLLNVVGTTPETDGLTSVALFFIIFEIGLELRTKVMGRFLKRALLISVTSFAVPLLVGFAVCEALLPFRTTTNFVVALGIAVPSISIISVLVTQEGILDREGGQIILASTVMTDVVAFVLLSSVSGTVEDTYVVVAGVSAFFAIFVLADFLLNRRPWKILRSLKKLGRLTRRRDISYAALIALGFVVASLFEAIGVSYIIGAFFAGLIVHEGLVGKGAFDRVAETFSRMNRAFFIPIFFGFAGVAVTLSPATVAELPSFAVALLGTVPVSIALSYLAARYALKTTRAATKKISVIMGGRGAVGIVIMTVALSRNLVGGSGYSLVIFGTVIASIVVPIFLKDRGRRRSSSGPKERAPERAEAKPVSVID